MSVWALLVVFAGASLGGFNAYRRGLRRGLEDGRRNPSDLEQLWVTLTVPNAAGGEVVMVAASVADLLYIEALRPGLDLDDFGLWGGAEVRIRPRSPGWSEPV